jgi:hypothetical protein
MRRVGLLFLLFFLLTSVASGVFVRWFVGGFGHGGPRGGGFWLPLPLLGLAVLAIVVAAGRAPHPVRGDLVAVAAGAGPYRLLDPSGRTLSLAP